MTKLKEKFWKCILLSRYIPIIIRISFHPDHNKMVLTGVNRDRYSEG